MKLEHNYIVVQISPKRYCVACCNTGTTVLYSIMCTCNTEYAARNIAKAMKAQS